MTHRTFICTILAAALALAGLTAAPARAGDDDLAKWIAGAAALAIIGAAIADKDDAAVTRYRHHRGHHGRTHRHHDRYHKVLPGRCHVRLHTRAGPLRGFGRHCLRRHYGHHTALPRKCATRIGHHRHAGGRHLHHRHHAHHGRVVYRGRCLHRHGYRMGQGR
jgi:hypothetical protein